jgi:hypothetical protein
VVQNVQQVVVAASGDPCSDRHSHHRRTSR